MKNGVLITAIAIYAGFILAGIFFRLDVLWFVALNAVFLAAFIKVEKVMANEKT